MELRRRFRASAKKDGPSVELWLDSIRLEGVIPKRWSVRLKGEKGSSGKPVLLPVILEPPIESAATQGDDGVGAADSPEHAGSLAGRKSDAPRLLVK